MTDSSAIMRLLAFLRFPFYAVFLMESAFPVFPDNRALNVSVLVLDDVNLLSLAAAVDPMRAANRHAGRVVFNWSYVTANGCAAKSTAGINIPGTAVANAPAPDILILVASFQIDLHSTAALHRELRRFARAGSVIVAVDGGGWILADAGLLDGRAATTHWEDLDRFATRFPRVQAVRDRFRISGRFLTTGGASPCLDMMLGLIRAHAGSDVAARVAGVFIYDPIHEGDAPQRLVPTAALARRAPLVARGIEILEARLDTPPKISDLAAELGVSRRSLEAQFKSALGQSPYAFGLALRLSEGRRLARDTNLSVQEIALACGFSTHAAFARAFNGAFGTSVSMLRKARGGL